MEDPIDELLIDVRANTQGFASDIAEMRNTFDASLIGSFEKAGGILEAGLMRAIRNGSLGFDDLKRAGLQAINQIASQAISSGLSELFGSGGSNQSSGVASLLSNVAGSILGLPGRATGGPVSPGRGYLVGETGPEIFVPTSAGRVENSVSTAPSARSVRVSINLPQSNGVSAPVAMQRSSRQIASSVRRALREA